VKNTLGAVKNEGVDAVEGGARGVLEIFLCGIDDCEIEAGFQELEQGVALHNECSGFPLCTFQRFVEGLTKERKALRKEALLCTEPKGPARACGEETRAVGAGVRAGFPADGADVVGGRAIAIVAILRTDAVAVLRDLPRNPSHVRECGDYVAHELRLADAAGVAANDDHAPGRHCGFFTCWQFSPLVL